MIIIALNASDTNLCVQSRGGIQLDAFRSEYGITANKSAGLMECETV